MINNIEKIKMLLAFDSEDDFYHLQILKRKKEHTDLGSNSYVVKTYYIRSIEYLDKKYEEMKLLCEFHNARACINLNKRSFKRIAFHTLKKVTDQIMNEDFKSVRKAYESCCGAHSNETNKKWIIDIDDKEYNPSGMLRYIEGLMPNPKTSKLIDRLETKNGYHLIVSPFDISTFKEEYHEIDIHKDNPTILYIPNIREPKFKFNEG